MRLLLICLIFLSFGIQAQITVGVNDFSDGGDTVRISTTMDPSIDFLSTGPNSTWDFSGLTANAQKLLDYDDLSNAGTLVQFMFGTFAPNNYKATNSLPNSDLPLDQMSAFLPVSIEDVRLFSKNATDSITSVGLSMVIQGTEVPVKSDTIETRYKFPMNYMDEYSSRGYTLLDMNPIYNGIWVQYRQRYSIVDGWGSITTPYGTFDALRVKHQIDETDSLFLDFIGQWFELPVPRSYIYEWITNNELEPILRIKTSEFGGNETVTGIEYKDIYLGLDAGIIENELGLTVGPNPTSGLIKIKGITAECNYQLINSVGSIIGEEELKNGQIDISQHAQGVYLLKIFNDSGASLIRIIKK